jgi:phytoene synthase
VSVRIFGCTDPGADGYAVALGRALQLTNILRDLREDYENGGRIYLPLDELERFGYSESELADFTYNPSYLALMDFQATRAEGYFREADCLLPAGDFRALAPARIMGGIYRELLSDMRRGGFRVFEKRHRVSTPRKTLILLKHLIARRP